MSSVRNAATMLGHYRTVVAVASSNERIVLEKEAIERERGCKENPKTFCEVLKNDISEEFSR